LDYGKFVENCLIVISVVLTTASLINNSIGIAAVLVDWSLIALFIYTKIPSSLDSYFQTTAFRKDMSIRLGLVFFPAIIFFLFLPSAPFGFFLLPKGLEDLTTMDLSVPILGAVAIVFISIFYFYWRIWNCFDSKLAQKLWRKASESEEDYKRDLALAERSRIDRFFTRSVGTGLIPMAVSVILFFSWLILAIIDVLLAIFLLSWLTYNVLYEIIKKHTSLRNRIGFTYKFFVRLDKVLAWESLVQTGLAGTVGGVMEVIMITGCFCLLILTSFVSLAAFIVMFGLLSQWYVLIVLVQIARRNRYQKKASKKSKPPPTLPNYSNIVLTACLIMLVGFSVAGYMDIQESRDALRIFLVLFLMLNIATATSIALWTRKKKSKKTGFDFGKSLRNDNYRLYAIFYALGLLLALLGKSLRGVGFWTTLSGALILLNTHDSIRKKFRKTTPTTFATVTTLHMALGTYIILGSAINFIPELSTLMITLAVILGALLILMWLETLRGYSLHITEPKENAHSE